MKKNGFIATSVLYSFFLVFITLFIALVMNYLHNQVLIKSIDNAAWETLFGINNTKISDLKVGDYLKFKMTSGQTFLNEDARWIVAYIEEEGDNKTYYFLSDITVHNPNIYYLLKYDQIEKWHPASIDVFNELNSYNAYTNAFLYKGMTVDIPSLTFIENIRSQDIPNIKKEAIFVGDGGFVVYIDKNNTEYTHQKYYEYRTYLFSASNQSIVNDYCHATANGMDVTYDDNNTFGYVHVMDESLTNETYVDYCYYASPSEYTHDSKDNIVNFDESKENGDLIESTNSMYYMFRLVAKVTTNENDENSYIAGGRGTSLDPYLVIDGGKV